MELWVFGATVLGTSFLSGVMGMAGGMILMGVLAYHLPVTAAMALHGATQITANGARAALLHRSIAWGGIRNYVIGFVVALSLFAVSDYVPPKRLIYLSLGILPFVGLLVPKAHAPDFSKLWHQRICGFLVGIVQMLAGASGAVLDMFFVRSGLDKNRTIATKAFTQVLGHGGKLAYYGTLLVAAKDATLTPAWLGVAVVAAIVGTKLGTLVADRLDEGRFRALSSAAIALIGVVYLYKAMVP